MNFCRIYNRTMMKLNKGFQRKDHINIFIGILEILCMIWLWFLDKYIFNPIFKICLYVMTFLHGVPHIERKSSLDMYQSFLSIGFAIFIISMLSLLTYISYPITILFIILLFMDYFIFTFGIAIVVAVFHEEHADKMIRNLIVYPLNKIMAITTSKCDLNNK